MTTLYISAFAFSVVCSQIFVVLSVVKLDAFLDDFHQMEPEIWREKNCPTGIFWRPPEPVQGQAKGGHLSRLEFLLDISFSTPGWVQDRPVLATSLHAYQRFYWGSLITGSAAVICAILLVILR